MTKPDWADLVSEWVDPDDWELTDQSVWDIEPNHYHLPSFAIRASSKIWSAKDRINSGTWVVDMVQRMPPEDVTLIVRGVTFKKTSLQLRLRPVEATELSDAFWRVDAARRVLRGQR